MNKKNYDFSFSQFIYTDDDAHPICQCRSTRYYNGITIADEDDGTQTSRANISSISVISMYMSVCYALHGLGMILDICWMLDV